MSHLDSTLKLINIPITEFQYLACKFLEQRGLRFCVDYVFENANTLCAQILMEEPSGSIN